MRTRDISTSRRGSSSMSSVLRDYKWWDKGSCESKFLGIQRSKLFVTCRISGLSLVRSVCTATLLQNRFRKSNALSYVV